MAVGCEHKVPMADQHGAGARSSAGGLFGEIGTQSGAGFLWVAVCLGGCIFGPALQCPNLQPVWARLFTRHHGGHRSGGVMLSTCENIERSSAIQHYMKVVRTFGNMLQHNQMPPRGQ